MNQNQPGVCGGAAQNGSPRRGFTLIEVAVSSVVLGVVALSYASIYKLNEAQRAGNEELVVAMEIASRQIEFLRSADETATAPPDAPPFTSAYQSVRTIPVPYGTVGTLEPSAAKRVPEAAFLVAANSFEFPNAGTTGAANIGKGGTWLTGDGTQPSPAELILPAELRVTGGKEYGVVVRAARVRTSPGLGPNGNVFESLLIKYQVEVYRSGRPVLVVPYLKKVRI